MSVNMEHHPLLGRVVGQEINSSRFIYTRTVVLWAVGVIIDTDQLVENIVVANRQSDQDTPVVRMLSSSTCIRGTLKKRLKKRPFRSVLSLSIAALVNGPLTRSVND